MVMLNDIQDNNYTSSYYSRPITHNATKLTLRNTLQPYSIRRCIFPEVLPFYAALY
jgi:hypothetical protein